MITLLVSSSLLCIPYLLLPWFLLSFHWSGSSGLPQVHGRELSRLYLSGKYIWKSLLFHSVVGCSVTGQIPDLL